MAAPQEDDAVVPEIEDLINGIWPKQANLPFRTQCEVDHLAGVVEVARCFTLPVDHAKPADRQAFYGWEAYRFKLLNERWTAYSALEDHLGFLWEYLRDAELYVDPSPAGPLTTQWPDMLIKLANCIIERYRAVYEQFSEAGVNSLIGCAIYIASLRLNNFNNIMYADWSLRHMQLPAVRLDMLKVSLVAHYLPELLTQHDGDGAFVPWEAVFELGEDLFEALKAGGGQENQALEKARRKNKCFDFPNCKVDIPAHVKRIIDLGFVDILETSLKLKDNSPCPPLFW